MASNSELENLKRLRERKGFRQEDVSEFFGLGANGRITISKWENGEAKPGAKHRQRFINYLAHELELQEEPELFTRLCNSLFSLWGWHSLFSPEKDEALQTIDKSPKNVSSKHMRFADHVLVIGQKLDNADSILWDSEEPSVTDYDNVILDLTTKTKDLPPPGANSVAEGWQYNLSDFLTWTNIRNRLERLLLSGGKLFIVLNQESLLHPDVSRRDQYMHQFQSILPFTTYGEPATGKYVSLSDHRFDFYFQILSSWSFILTGRIEFNFESIEDTNYTIEKYAIASNKVREPISISVKILNKLNNSISEVFILPSTEHVSSSETIKSLVENLYKF